MAEANSTQLKSCEHCCAPFTSIIPKARYCSDKCQRVHYRQAHKPSKKHGPYTCKQCSSVFYRDNDRRTTFCSRECNFEHRKAIKAELALEAAAELEARAKARAKAREEYRSSLLRSEVMAIKAIRQAVLCRTKECPECRTSFIRLRPYFRCCSARCHEAGIERKAIEKACRPRTERAIAGRRAAKSKRRALIRGASQVDTIDPIKVFERDKWRCHMCGIKKPRELRGSTEDNAPELEHIISIAQGGTHTWGNVACSCRSCNIGKGSASFGQLGLGFAA